MSGSRITSIRIFSTSLIVLIALLGCSKKREEKRDVLFIETAYTMKKNDLVETALKKHLPESRVTYPIIDALRRAGFPFRRCLPGDSINIMTRDGEFFKLAYYQNPKQIYYVFQDQGCLSVAMKLPYIEESRCLIRGTINSTLYESVIDIGEKPYLAFRFADIFAWEVDFVTDTRSGDSFFIYCDKQFCDSTFVEYDNISYARYKGEIGDFVGIYFKDDKGNEDYYNLKGESLRKSLLKSPLKFSYISSYFSNRRFHPILKIWRPHHGLDYVAPVGTPVTSIGDGIVLFKGWKGGYGNLIEIQHKNSIKTRYGHLSRFAKNIKKGKRVKMGELIGYVGATGLATGPHLHFEMHRNGVPINPLKANIPRAPSVRKECLTQFNDYCDSLTKVIEEYTKESIVPLANKE